jgi:hypothetical protein
MTAVLSGLPLLVQQSVERFVAFLETGETRGLFAPDVFADISLPHWRLQVRGAETLVSSKNQMHPPAGRTRIEKVLPAEDGYAVKFEERWEDGGQQWYCREAAIVDLDEQGRITEFHYYCTGDWDEALVAQHAEAVSLIRP